MPVSVKEILSVPAKPLLTLTEFKSMPKLGRISLETPVETFTVHAPSGPMKVITPGPDASPGPPSVTLTSTPTVARSSRVNIMAAWDAAGAKAASETADAAMKDFRTFMELPFRVA
jgi:hypothetical protein